MTTRTRGSVSDAAQAAAGAAPPLTFAAGAATILVYRMYLDDAPPLAVAIAAWTAVLNPAVLIGQAVLETLIRWIETTKTQPATEEQDEDEVVE